MASAIEEIAKALHDDDAARVRDLIEAHPEFRARIKEPLCHFDAPVITCARSREMLDVLLGAGADINAKSNWWAGGFGLLHTAHQHLAEYAIERGASVDVHAAARLGLMAKLVDLISAEPQLVHARGGDGQTPLHFAANAEVANYLLDHGAEIDARDVDHESTPAQYMVGDRHDVLRCLIQRGCKTDIFMAAALGDAGLVRNHLDKDPACVRMRVSADFFPMISPKAGGTIYQWTLGWHVSPHEVAMQRGHEEIVQVLMAHSPANVRLLVACWAGEANAVRALLAENPRLGVDLPAVETRQLAHAARNNNLAAVRLMLTAGLPIDARGQHNGTALHWAAWHGNAEMVRELLRHDPPLEALDSDFQSTPVGWAIHGSENGWHRERGDYAAVLEALLDAGAKPPQKLAGSDAIQAVLQRVNRCEVGD